MLRVVAGRFGMLSVLAIAVLVITGVYQYIALVPPHVKADFNATNFGLLFTLKMGMFAVLLLLIYLHTYRFSRRIRTLSDRVIACQADPARAG